MLLLDTLQHPARDRAEILHSGLAALAGVDLAPMDGDDLIKLRFRAWDLGDGCSLLHAQSSGFQFRRRPPRDSSDESPVIGFSMMPAAVPGSASTIGRRSCPGEGCSSPR